MLLTFDHTSNLIFIISSVVMFYLVFILFINYIIENKIRNYIFYDNNVISNDDYTLKSKYNLDIYVYMVNIINKCDEFICSIEELKELKNKYAEIPFDIIDNNKEYTSNKNVDILGLKYYYLLLNNLAILQQVYNSFYNQIDPAEQKRIAMQIKGYQLYVENNKNVFDFIY